MQRHAGSECVRVFGAGSVTAKLPDAFIHARLRDKRLRKKLAVSLKIVNCKVQKPSSFEMWPGGSLQPVGTARPLLLQPAQRGRGAASHTAIICTPHVTSNTSCDVAAASRVWLWPGRPPPPLPQPARRQRIPYSQHKHSALLWYRRFTSCWLGQQMLLHRCLLSRQRVPVFECLFLLFFSTFYHFPVGSY